MGSVQVTLYASGRLNEYGAFTACQVSAMSLGSHTRHAAGLCDHPPSTPASGHPQGLLSDPDFAGLGASTGAPGRKQLLSRGPSDPRQPRTQTGLAETPPTPTPTPSIGDAASSGSPSGCLWERRERGQANLVSERPGCQSVPDPFPPATRPRWSRT